MKHTPIHLIKPNPNNPRKLDAAKFEKLKKSLQEFPEMLEKRPLVVADGFVLGGNMRLRAAQELKFETVPVIDASEWSQEQRDQFLIKDNVSFGEWDWDVLANEWDPVQLEEWGLDVWQPDAEPGEGLTDPDDVPEVPEAPTTQAGDLYLLGKHRLLCGDSTNADDVARLMDGKKADMVFTDPPYGIGYEYNSHEDKQGDEYLAFCVLWFANLKNYADFICISTGWRYNPFWYSQEPVDCFYWLSKNKRSGGKISHFRKIEPLFFWGKPANKYNFDYFEQTTEIDQSIKGAHTCPKPVTLIESIIEGAKKGGLILDIFMGSGTTLIAAEKTGRACYGMELDPKYCDVIVKRWEDFTGKKAERVTKA
jgi:DNA modification methylase